MNNPFTHRKYLWGIFTVFALFSCRERVWDNPFDPECPKEIFTPTDLNATQEGNQIKLTWNQKNNQITGFIISRKENNGNWLEVERIPKGTNTYFHVLPVIGIQYGYQVVAYAESNFSNPLTTNYTALALPTVKTEIQTNVTATSAVLGGNVISDGGSVIIERGVVYSTNQHPTTSNLKFVIGNGTGSFAASVIGLSADSIYYFRAYATNQVGTAYGEEQLFIASSSKIIDIDRNVYNIITIGTQTWLKENLKTTRFRNGDAISYWTKTSPNGYCWYNDDINNKNVYGAIYNYYTTADSRNICPAGWHIPSNEEWEILIKYLGGADVAGGKLKEAGTTHWTSPNTEATNSSEFTALPGGARDCGNNYVQMGIGCHFWSSKIVTSGWVNGIYLDYRNGKVVMSGGYDCNASYVRCIKD